VRKAFVVFFLSVTLIIVSVFVLNEIENFSLMKITFETVSAFGCVGLSTGITPLLSNAGKMIIMAVMFIARVGAVAMLSASRRKRRTRESGKRPLAEFPLAWWRGGPRRTLAAPGRGVLIP
jgi:trk system potassium uptake protein TrkH